MHLTMLQWSWLKLNYFIKELLLIWQVKKGKKLTRNSAYLLWFNDVDKYCVKKLLRNWVPFLYNRTHHIQHKILNFVWMVFTKNRVKMTISRNKSNQLLNSCHQLSTLYAVTINFGLLTSLFPTSIQTFNSQKWWTFNFSPQYPYVIQQTGNENNQT